MKRYGNLWSEICTLENLELADKKARKGKAKYKGIECFDKNKEVLLQRLLDTLVSGTYKTSPYKIFTIRDPKERLIYKLPYYPDRIAQHAVMNILQPLFNSVFTADTYSCIKGRGVHKGVNNLKTALKDVEGTKYCLKLDVVKFYPSIDNDILKLMLRKKFKDAKLLAFLDQIIDSSRGLPIGNYLSQTLANFYLTYFDHYIKEVKKVQYFFRYCDDIVLLSGSKEELHKWLHEVKAYLRQELRLEVKNNYQVFPVEDRGIDFLGYKFYHTHTLLRKSIKVRMKRAFRRNKVKSLPSYFGWAKHCNSKNLIKTLNETIYI